MKTDDLKTVVALEGRGTKFNPPIPADRWWEFEGKIHRGLGQDFKRLYSIGNGFINYDRGNELRLWTIDEIINNEDPEDNITNKSGWIAIGDFMINSDIILARIFDAVSSARLSSDEAILATSLEILAEMAAGRFDF